MANGHPMNTESYWTAKLNRDNTVSVLLEQAVDNHSAWDFILISEFFINTPAACSYGYINRFYTQPLLQKVHKNMSLLDKNESAATPHCQNVCLYHKRAFGLAIILTFDLWPWKHLQQCPLILLNICAKCHLTLSTKCRDIAWCEKGVNVGWQMDN